MHQYTTHPKTSCQNWLDQFLTREREEIEQLGPRCGTTETPQFPEVSFRAHQSKKLF